MPRLLQLTPRGGQSFIVIVASDAAADEACSDAFCSI
jgi:hypothetical protein